MKCPAGTPGPAIGRGGASPCPAPTAPTTPAPPGMGGRPASADPFHRGHASSLLQKACPRSTIGDRGKGVDVVSSNSHGRTSSRKTQAI